MNTLNPINLKPSSNYLIDDLITIRSINAKHVYYNQCIALLWKRYLLLSKPQVIFRIVLFVITGYLLQMFYVSAAPFNYPYIDNEILLKPKTITFSLNSELNFYLIKSGSNEQEVLDFLHFTSELWNKCKK
jgi:hypothetical protein